MKIACLSFCPNVLRSGVAWIFLALISPQLACDKGDSQGYGGRWDDDNDVGEAEGGEGEGEGEGDGGVGVGQGGSQDFGQFRSILEAGDIPGPSTIDDVGFFNEHKISFPKPDCGGDVCIHGQLGVMGNFISGSPCSMVVVGLNTPINPKELTRPPLNLAIVVDTSGSMAGEPIGFLRQGLGEMIPHLEPHDRISLIRFSSEAELLVEHQPGSSLVLQAAIDGLDANGGTNLYDGLALAYDTVERHFDSRFQNRVILLSDGQATKGETNANAIANLAAEYGRRGMGMTSMGVGVDFDAPLMRRLAETGWGSFYYLEDPRAVTEVFTEEVSSFMIPLAQDVKITADIANGYTLRALYGTKLDITIGNHSEISIPILQIAHRESADDAQKGRRGGGGAIVLETIPNGGATDEVGSLRFEYTVPGTSERIVQTVDIRSPLDPNEVPEGGYFPDDQVSKAFVMLNIYAGFELAAFIAAAEDYGRAIATLEALREGVESWLSTSSDRDIQDDLRYIDLFIANLYNADEDPGGDENCCEDIDTWPED